MLYSQKIFDTKKIHNKHSKSGYQPDPSDRIIITLMRPGAWVAVIRLTIVKS